MVDRRHEPDRASALRHRHAAPPPFTAPPFSASTFTARLDRWVAEARVAEATLARSRERWLHETAEQDSTLGGVLIDLAERRAPLMVHTRHGRDHHGIVGVIGTDFVALEVAAGPDLLVASRAIGFLRTGPAVQGSRGDRVVATELRLAEVLAELAADREHVVLQTESGQSRTAGQLRTVGHDVAVLLTDADPPSTVYVALAAITEVLLN